METKSSHSSSKRLRGKYIPKTELVPENDAWKTTSLSLPGNFSQAIVLCIYSYTYIYIHVYSCIQSVNTVNTIHAYCIHINIQVYQLWGLYEKKTRWDPDPLDSTTTGRSLRRASHHLPGTIFTSCCSHLPWPRPGTQMGGDLWLINGGSDPRKEKGRDWITVKQILL